MKVSETIHPNLFKEIKNAQSSSHDLREYLHFLYNDNGLNKQSFDSMNQII